MGMPVAQIFGMMGEPRFREMERDAVAAAGARSPAVIVPGGGWAAQPGQLEAGPGQLLVIYLKCTAAPRPAGASRARSAPAGGRRPRATDGDSWRRGNRSTGSLIMRSRRNVKHSAVVAEGVIRVARTQGGW